MNTFAQRLSSIVTDTAELADYLGCSIQAISQFKRGTSYPKIENIAKIAKHYDVSIDYLFGLTDVRTPDINVQAVSKYTGLSEKSIETLHAMAEHGYVYKLRRTDYDIAYNEHYLSD